MIWKEVLCERSFIGGYLETTDHTTRFGGPILRMEMPDKSCLFTFRLEWCAQKPLASHPDDYMWDICPDPKRCVVTFDYTLVGIPRPAADKHSFHFKLPGLGETILLPKGYYGKTGTILEPIFVKGLKDRRTGDVVLA